MTTSILELFQNYGLVITILLIAISLAYLIIKNSTKRIREQEDKIDSLYDKIDDLVKNSSDKHDKYDLTNKFTSFAENAGKIQIQLYHLLQVFGADRISIFEFHNGGKNLAGVEFKKCSNTNEAVSLEIKPNQKELQNLPLSLNPMWNKILGTRENIIISDTSQLEDSFLKSYLDSQQIKAYYSTILEDYDNTPIGFINVEYYRNSSFLNKEQLDEFIQISNKIAVLINVK